MSELTSWLTSILNFGAEVANDTGLTGNYSFRLEWLPEPDVPSAALFTAVQEQLGLKLVEHRGPVDVLAIDHAEQARPDE